MSWDEWSTSSSEPDDKTELQRLRAAEEQLSIENENLRETVHELERVRDMYFELYDLAAVGLVALNQHGVIQNVNLAAAGLFGKDRKVLVGHVLHLLVHGEDQARLHRHLLACQNLDSSTGELRLRLLRDSVPLRLSTRWVHTCDGACILAALIDEREDAHVTLERQRLVEAEQRARHESESKDQFIAMLSHELRTPLTPILAACSTLKEDPRLDPSLRAVFARIARNAQAEARLIDDLLDATGILRGKVSIVRVPVDVHGLLLECAEALKPDSTHKSQYIELGLDAAECWVSGDPLRLRQVFTNLLRNAIKFTPVAGSIYVRSWNSNARLVVDVEDSGIGFAPESTRRIFEPFDQLNDKPQTGGLGLGLAIARGLVELHDGKIDGASRGAGQGARFVVDLPTVAAPTEPLKSESSAITHLLPTREQCLLLVEDHEDTAEMLRELLQLSGYTVVLADSVASALAADSEQVDMVISDLGLPDGTGAQLIRKLQAIRRRPAIALSGYGMDSDVRASHQAGFDVHLTKPVTAGQLLGAIQALRNATSTKPAS